MLDTENHRPEYYVGVDLGGTKILGGVYTSALEFRGKCKLSTKWERGAEAVAARIARCVRDTVDEADLCLSDVRAVGLGVPGAVDPGSGLVRFAPNLGWRNVPLRDMLQEQLDVPVFLENDGQVATLGIYEVELKGRPRHLLGIFIGTGIGGGLLLNGELYSGFANTAGEIGHMVMEINGPACNCGNRGCFEALASRTAMIRQIKAAVEQGEPTVLSEMLKNLDTVRSGDLRRALRRGDKLVARVVQGAAEYIGIAVGNLLNVLNPEVVALGGGILESLGDDMMGIIVETARDYTMTGRMDGVEIINTLLGDHAGITGAAVLARQMTK